MDRSRTPAGGAYTDTGCLIAEFSPAVENAAFMHEVAALLAELIGLTEHDSVPWNALPGAASSSTEEAAHDGTDGSAPSGEFR